MTAPRKPKATVTVVLTEEERDALVKFISITWYGNPAYPLVDSAWAKLRRARVAKRRRS